jgi:type II secretory pathway component GspD/PulD (secretin)
MPALLSAKIVADKRTNSLIISGPEKARQRITSLLKSLDVEESEEGNTRVYYLKYAKATNLVEVLTGVSEKLKDEKGNARKPSSSGAMDNVAITADEQTNSLVITADQSVQEKLATVIARLDIRRAQVLVEAIIVEVQDGNGLNLGVQWANKNVGAQQFTNTGLPVFNAAQGVADYKKNGGITSANRVIQERLSHIRVDAALLQLKQDCITGFVTSATPDCRVEFASAALIGIVRVCVCCVSGRCRIFTIGAIACRFCARVIASGCGLLLFLRGLDLRRCQCRIG